MINIITVSLYGRDVLTLGSELKELGSSFNYAAFYYSYVYVGPKDDEDIKLFEAFVDFLDEKKGKLDLEYKIFYEAQMEADSRVRNIKDKSLLKSGYFKFLPHCYRMFNPCNLDTLCDSYFTFPLTTSHLEKEKKFAEPGKFTFDLDGFLYSYFPIAEKIQHSKFTGIAFQGLQSNDQDKWLYTRGESTSGVFDERIREWYEATAKKFGCELDDESMYFLLTKEQNKSFGKEFFDYFVKHLRERGHETPEAYIDIYPPPLSGGPKWFLTDIKQVQEIESSQTQYTTKNRTCPHCGKVYPLLTSFLHLKKSSIPDLDFFRTENNHLIISKRVYDFFQKEKILPMESYCEPVILV